jgi:hypothetical protein
LVGMVSTYIAQPPELNTQQIPITKAQTIGLMLSLA